MPKSNYPIKLADKIYANASQWMVGFASLSIFNVFNSLHKAMPQFITFIIIISIRVLKHLARTMSDHII